MFECEKTEDTKILFDSNNRTMDGMYGRMGLGALYSDFTGERKYVYKRYLEECVRVEHKCFVHISSRTTRLLPRFVSD